MGPIRRDQAGKTFQYLLGLGAVYTTGDKSRPRAGYPPYTVTGARGSGSSAEAVYSAASSVRNPAVSLGGEERACVRTCRPRAKQGRESRESSSSSSFAPASHRLLVWSYSQLFILFFLSRHCVLLPLSCFCRLRCYYGTFKTRAVLSTLRRSSEMRRLLRSVITSLMTRLRNRWNCSFIQQSCWFCPLFNVSI